MRKRSMSLFQPSVNSTVNKFEGTDFANPEDNDDLIQHVPFIEYLKSEVIDEEYSDDMVPNKCNDLKYCEMLVELVEKHIKCRNEKRFFTHSFKKHVKWDKVAELLNKSVDVIQTDFEDIRKEMGRYRSIAGNMTDMKNFIRQKNEVIKKNERPKKPISPYLRFANEIRPQLVGFTSIKDKAVKIGQMWRELTPKKKLKYAKKYRAEMEEYYADNPEEKKSTKPKKVTPFSCFYENAKTKNPQLKHADAFANWKNLNLKKKIPFIKSAYGASNSTLSKSEMEIMAELNGKPKKAFHDVFYFYFSEANDPKDTRDYHQRVKDYRAAFKSLPLSEKNEYIQRYNAYLLDYNKKLQKYQLKYPNDVEDSPTKKRPAPLEIKDTGAKKIRISSVFEIPENNGVVKEKSKKKEKHISTVPDTKEQSISDMNIISEEKPTKKKKKTKKSTDEIQIADSDVLEVKKENKKDSPKKKIKKFLSKKPPPTLYEYYINNIYTGSNKHKMAVKESFHKLPKKSRTELKKQYKGICDSFTSELKNHLKTLSPEEINVFVKKLKDTASEIEQSDFTDTSDESSDSEDSGSTDEERESEGE